jgi:hypothetical protein
MEWREGRQLLTLETGRNRWPTWILRKRSTRCEHITQTTSSDSWMTNVTAKMKSLPEVGGVDESGFHVYFGHRGVEIVFQLVGNTKRFFVIDRFAVQRRNDLAHSYTAAKSAWHCRVASRASARRRARRARGHAWMPWWVLLGPASVQNKFCFAILALEAVILRI